MHLSTTQLFTRRIWKSFEIFPSFSKYVVAKSLALHAPGNITFQALLQRRQAFTSRVRVVVLHSHYGLLGVAYKIFPDQIRRVRKLFEFRIELLAFIRLVRLAIDLCSRIGQTKWTPVQCSCQYSTVNIHSSNSWAFRLDFLKNFF